jgi:hypothetical protein
VSKERGKPVKSPLFVLGSTVLKASPFDLESTDNASDFLGTIGGFGKLRIFRNSCRAGSSGINRRIGNSRMRGGTVTALTLFGYAKCRKHSVENRGYDHRSEGPA